MTDETAGVQILVDPRIELMSAVQLLCDYELVTRYDFAYKRAMREKVAPYRDHPVVKRFVAMSKQGFSFDAVPNALLSLTEPPALMQRVPFSDYLR